MKDSFGGTFMINLMLVFIVIYISFMCIVISYSKAFRVKNSIINILEQNMYSGSADKDTITKVDDYLRKVPYFEHDHAVKECKNKDAIVTDQGACIIDMSKDNEEYKYFKVITYIAIEFPFFNLSLVVPISGETKTIYY